MTSGSPPVADVRALVDRLDLDEKAALTAGSGAWHTTPVERLGIGRLKVTDGPTGARGDGVSGQTATCFPVGVALGASWDVELLARIGAALAGEARSKGSGVLLGPTVNLHRLPLAGRNFECYSEDPTLTAHLAAAFITGLQSNGVGACLKHFVANDSEFERYTISSEVDERVLRELYLRPFEYPIARGGSASPWSIMASYNRVNGTYSCEHRWLLTEVLRDEWGYDGVVVSDWYAVHETDRTAVSGLDLEMPGPAQHLGPKVADAVRDGRVPASELDVSVERLLQLLVRTGVITPDGTPGPHAGDAEAAERSDDREELAALAGEAAAAGMVLLRNEAAALPLGPRLDAGAVRSVAVIGPNAEVGRHQGGGSSEVRSRWVVQPLEAIRARLTTRGVEVTHAPGCVTYRFLPVVEPATWRAPWDDDDPAARPVLLEYFASVDLTGAPVQERRVANMGAAWFGHNIPGLDPERFSCRYTATFTARRSGTHRFGCSGVGRSRVLVDGAVVADQWGPPVLGASMFGWGTDEAVGEVDLVEGQQVTVALEYGRNGEGQMAAVRLGLLEPTGDLLGPAVEAARAADVAVVIVGSSPDCESEGYDRAGLHLVGEQDALVAAVAAANPNTIVVVNAGSPVAMPWVDDVAAVLQVWFGGQSFGDALADVLVGEVEPGGRLPSTFGRRLEDWPGWLAYPGEGGKVHYAEGVFMGYRGFDELGIEPLFCFGHGLGYTTWSMSDLSVTPHDDGGAEVAVTVTNTGDRPGSTVVQVYVGDDEASVRRPPRELAGFAKVRLDAGETRRVVIVLDARAFAFWHPDRRCWLVEPGSFTIHAGWSSRDLPLTAEIVRVD